MHVVGMTMHAGLTADLQRHILTNAQQCERGLLSAKPCLTESAQRVNAQYE